VSGPPAGDRNDPLLSPSVRNESFLTREELSDTVVDDLTPDDAAECARLEAILFPGDDPWTTAAFRSELRAGHPYLAARRADRLVGYAGIALLPAPAFSREPGEAEVHTIGVAPEAQGLGIGRRLLRGLLARADALGAVTFLEVRTDNAPALALYRSEGFEVLGTRRRYYASGADAFTMRREPPR
jgi:[ribosomal protein S18]-alanine N-acetyltransferase